MGPSSLMTAGGAKRNFNDLLDPEIRSVHIKLVLFIAQFIKPARVEQNEADNDDRQYKVNENIPEHRSVVWIIEQPTYSHIS